MKKKLFLLIIAILLFGQVDSARAAASHSVHGWLWGGEGSSDSDGAYEGTGWWSMNNLDCDVDGNGFVDVNCSGDNMTTIGTPYGVNIPLSGDGNLSGYGWSEHYGWISFEPADVKGCPSGAGTCPARREGGYIIGWARILSIKTEARNSGGWSGWVALSSKTLPVTNPPSPEFGVTISQSPDENGRYQLGGYAYSDELGWIDFSRAWNETPKILKICLGGCTLSGTVISGTSRVIRGSTILHACLTSKSDTCVGNTAGDLTMWASDNLNRLPVSPSPASITTARPQPGEEVGLSPGISITATTPNYGTAIAVFGLPCTPQCDYRGRTANQICKGTSITGTDTRCGTTCTLSGTKDCDSGWTEVTP